jgi:hypothetical protein
LRADILMNKSCLEEKYRDLPVYFIEDLLAERGITVSRESIRLWCTNSALYTPED